MSALKRLIAHSSNSFVNSGVARNSIGSGRLGDELYDLLSIRNGAFFFSQSLRLFPSADCDQSYGLTTWNSRNLWRSTFKSLASSVFFFAEDLFGFQFGILDDDIVRFDPETSEIHFLSRSFEGFGQAVVEDTDYLTGMSLAVAWQRKYGKLQVRHRLVPKVPLVLGGEFNVENLVSVESARAMRIRGLIATKIRNLPDGAVIEISFDESDF